MRPSVFDLRAFNLPPYLLGMVVTGLLAAAALYAATADRVIGGPSARTVAWVIGAVLAAMVLGGLGALPELRRRRRLVIDHEGIRIEKSGRKPELRMAWTELAGVALIRADRQRRRAVRVYRPLTEVPPALVAVGLLLELVPTGQDAVRRHPELARAWLLGGHKTWRVPLTVGPGEPPPIGPALQAHRPDLWRGERSGSALFG